MLTRRLGSLSFVTSLVALTACGGSTAAHNNSGGAQNAHHAAAAARELPHHRGPQPAAHGTAMAEGARIPVGESPVDGPADALVTIVEFGDARDYFTQQMENTLAEIRARYGDDVRIVWKTHPHSMLDPNGERTADALMAAQAQGRFWPMLEWVMAHPGASSEAQFADGARVAGVDVARFQQDVASRAHRAAIEADAHLARTLGGPEITPIFYVNGTRVIGAHAMERFVPLIDAALAAARTVTPRENAYANALENPPVDPEGTPVPGAGESRVVDLTQRYRVPVDHAPVWGHADAPVTIVSFEDFECPACARVEPILQQVKQRFANDVRIVWRNLPLWVHPTAIPAAEAGLAVYRLGGDTAFWRFHDTLYGNAGHGEWLSRPALESAAAPLGIDTNRYRAMLDSHETHDAVRDDLRMAARFGISATPGFFINGRMLTGVQPVERFARLIESAREEARAMTARGVAAADVYAQLTGSGPERVVYLPLAAGSTAEHPEPRYTLPDPSGAPSRGPANAPVTITWYGEYESLASARVAQAIERVAAHHLNAVRVVWRDLPGSGRPAAMPIAEAAREVFAQQGSDGFWRFSATLLANQRALAAADLERVAGEQHVDMARFRTAMTSHAHVAAIRADHDGLDDIGITAEAPTVFVNGRMLRGPALTEESLGRAVDAALAAAPSAAPASAAPSSPSSSSPPPRGRGRARH
jgi:protein-disulfide isomerase